MFCTAVVPESPLTRDDDVERTLELSLPRSPQSSTSSQDFVQARFIEAEPGISESSGIAEQF